MISAVGREKATWLTNPWNGFFRTRNPNVGDLEERFLVKC